MSAPLAYLLEDPFVWMLHSRISSAPWPSVRVNSTMKSATACPFIAVHGQYCISNLFSLTAHNVIYPAALGLPMDLDLLIFGKSDS